jgi:hypothetical protein
VICAVSGAELSKKLLSKAAVQHPKDHFALISRRGFWNPYLSLCRLNMAHLNRWQP